LLYVPARWLCVCMYYAFMKLCKQLAENFDTIRHQYWNYISAGIQKQLTIILGNNSKSNNSSGNTPKNSIATTASTATGSSSTASATSAASNANSNNNASVDPVPVSTSTQMPVCVCVRLI